MREVRATTQYEETLSVTGWRSCCVTIIDVTWSGCQNSPKPATGPLVRKLVLNRVPPKTIPLSYRYSKPPVSRCDLSKSGFRTINVISNSEQPGAFSRPVKVASSTTTVQFPRFPRRLICNYVTVRLRLFKVNAPTSRHNAIKCGAFYGNTHL
jgi:hypothetical protein